MVAPKQSGSKPHSEKIEKMKIFFLCGTVAVRRSGSVLTTASSFVFEPSYGGLVASSTPFCSAAEDLEAPRNRTHGVNSVTPRRLSKKWVPS